MIHGFRIPDPTNRQAVWSTWTSWANTLHNFWRTTNPLRGVVVLSVNLLILEPTWGKDSSRIHPWKFIFWNLKKGTSHLPKPPIFRLNVHFPKRVCPDECSHWFCQVLQSFFPWKFRWKLMDVEVKTGHRWTKRWWFQPTNFFKKYALLNRIISPRYYGLNIQRHIFETT